MSTEFLSKYDEKLERLDKSVRLEKVDRVPMAAATLYFPAKYSNISYASMFYDNEKYTQAASKFALDFNWDAVCFFTFI